MIHADEYKFDARRKKIGITFFGNKITFNFNTIEVAYVNLKYKGEFITVNNLKDIDIDTYKGKVVLFRNSRSVKYKDIILGDTIIFNKKHIFSCTIK